MRRALKLSMFRIGTTPASAQELRIAVTRRPPRGVPKERWTKDGYFDVWFPALAPSGKLIARIKDADLDDPRIREGFLDSYERELLSTAEGKQSVELMAHIAMRTPISIGCYCQDELKCHRSRLYSILQRQAAQLSSG